MTYAPNLPASFRRLATLVDRISRAPGRRSPSSYRRAWSIVVNLKTAKALGLGIPPAVLARANQVIE